MSDCKPAGMCNNDRPPPFLLSQVAGYATQYKNLAYVTMKGAGHMVRSVAGLMFHPPSYDRQMLVCLGVQAFRTPWLVLGACSSLFDCLFSIASSCVCICSWQEYLSLLVLTKCAGASKQARRSPRDVSEVLGEEVNVICISTIYVFYSFRSFLCPAVADGRNILLITFEQM